MSERTAGRALDCEIAERVIGEVEANAPCGDGLTRTDVFTGATLVECDALIRKAYAKHVAHGMKLWPAAYIGPEYSTDIAAAWLVVAAMVDRRWKVDVQNRYPGCFACHVNFPAHVTYGRVFEKADQLMDGEHLDAAQLAALAICRASITALEIVALPAKGAVEGPSPLSPEPTK